MFVDVLAPMENLISKLKQSILLQLFTITLRYLLGSAFVHASIFKIRGIRFMPKPAVNTPLNTLPHFFEAMYQADIYWHFIGWGQLMVGFLMMSQTFSTLGAVAFFPLILNIFVITISFNAPNILLTTSLMVLANIYLLIWDWNKLKFICLPKPLSYVDNNPALSKKYIWTYIGITLFWVIVLLRLYQTSHYNH